LWALTGVGVMMLAGFFVLLFLSDVVSPEGNCSYQDVLNHLNLSTNNELFFMTRPVKNYKHPTQVSLEVLLYAILDVVEKDQKFIPYVWTVMRWHNEYISWDPNQFCGIDNVSLPTDILWKPDLTIEEMVIECFGSLQTSDTLTQVTQPGVISPWLASQQQLTMRPPSSARATQWLPIFFMALFLASPTIPSFVSTLQGDQPAKPQHPSLTGSQWVFQSCLLHRSISSWYLAHFCSLASSMRSSQAKDIRLQSTDNSSEATECSREVMRTQYEWLFLNMTVTTNNASNTFGQDIVIYTFDIISQITMKRRSLLYIVNFLVPVLFFLCLDLASFLISDNGGEKLSFKVTVLLAVTVLQLILNEILPASSNKIPLIAVYCIGIFALMLLSLLETIFVMHLMEKDSASQEEDADKDRSLSEDCNKQGKANIHSCHGGMHKWTHCACIFDVSTGETPSELLPVAKEGTTEQQHNSSKLIEEYHALEKLSDELKEMEKTLSQLLSNRKEEEKPGYWTGVAKKVEVPQITQSNWSLFMINSPIRALRKVSIGACL
uniref:5-hydroxytryptamine receptor 3A-like n=1 Tax=Epinephelus lanceolatus TaxID=310571 RepID=UPI0014481CA3